MLGGAALAAGMPASFTPVFAHAVGPGSGVELELLLVAGVVLVYGLLVRSRGEVTRAGWIVPIVAGLVLGVASFALPQLTGGSSSTNATIQIASPGEGASLPAGPIQVSVTVKGQDVAGSANEAGSHIHIYIDGKLDQMPYKTSTEVTLKPGEHEITAELVDPNHAAYSPPVRDTVTVTVE
ncbi:MAG: hypothetical protein QOG54_720 [Actinomycetota bacterium]|jgi:hypothetical protein|nr:hypothetical protein [Actinomycetota bacterium]